MKTIVELSKAKREMIKSKISLLPRRPNLVILSTGSDEASKVYVKAKEKACEEVGIKCVTCKIDEDTTTQELIEIIDKLNGSSKADGIIVQLPLPGHIDESAVLSSINIVKDVDGLNPFNLGSIGIKDPLIDLSACTPKGIMSILDYYDVPLRGAHAVVIGTSKIVGKPMMLELIKADATVTVCNSKTKNLPSLTKLADILIVAVGKPKMVRADWVKDGATVIDVGINRLEGRKLCGDVDYDEVKKVAKVITPVPKGVGLMTVTSLLENVYTAYTMQMEPLKGVH